MIISISIIDNIFITFISFFFISINIIHVFVELMLTSFILNHVVIALFSNNFFMVLRLEALLLFQELIKLDVGLWLLAL